MKKVAILLVLLVLLMAIFSFFPTGAAADEIIQGYQSTTMFARSNSSQLLYLSQFQTVKNIDYDSQFSGTIGTQIASFAAGLCEDLGNGGNTSYSQVQGRKIGQFRYNISTTGYATTDQLTASIAKMRNDSNATSNISCCGFATYCWDVYLMGHSPYGTSSTATVSKNFQDIIEGDGTIQYIIEHASPGDLLFYTKTSGSAPPVASAGVYKHVEVYLGPYSGVDATGASYEIEHACAGSNQPSMRRDACIKSLETTVAGSSHSNVYLVSLAKWVSSGHTPVNNAAQVEDVS